MITKYGTNDDLDVSA